MALDSQAGLDLERILGVEVGVRLQGYMERKVTAGRLVPHSPCPEAPRFVDHGHNKLG